MSSRTLQWLSLVGIIWLQSITGTNSNFPAYSSQLKNLLSMSQTQLNDLAFASDAGKLLGWVSGLASIYLPLWLVLIIGSSLGLLGYGLQYLFLANQISSLSYGHIFVLNVLAGNSICWINTVSYVVAIRNFPSHRQIAVGLTTSYQGLSAKIYTDIVDAVFSSSPTGRAKAYLLLSSILPVIVCATAAPLAREVDIGRPRNMRVGFITMFVITIATGVYAVISSLESISGKLSPSIRAMGTVAFLLAPLVIPIADTITELVKKRKAKEGRKVYPFSIELSEGAERMEKGVVEERAEAGEVREQSEGAERVEKGVVEERAEAGEIREQSEGAERMENRGEERSEEDGEVLEQSEDSERMENMVEEREEAGEVPEVVVLFEEIGVWAMLKRVNFWLYFFVYFFGATLGLVFLNNLGQIAESRGYSVSATSALVSLSASFGFFGRLLPSLMDFYLSRTKYMISKPASILGLMVPTAGAFFLLVNDTNHSLHISTATIGVCGGAITSIAVSLTAELFGTKTFGVNHNVLVSNIPIGSFLFGNLAAMLYRKQASAEKCMGVECYRNTFIIWGSLCVLGTFLASILYARTRKLYSQTVYI